MNAGQAEERLDPSGAPRGLAADLLAAAACVLVAAVLGPFHASLALANSAMIFLLAVAVIAVRLGRRPAVVAAFCSVALFDFFLVPPRLSFAVSDAQYLVIFAVMLAVALIITHLTNTLRRAALEAGERERQTRRLYELARALSGSLTPAQVLAATRGFFDGELGAHVAIFAPDDAERLHPLDPSDAHITLVDNLAAHSVYAHGEAVLSDEAAGDDARTLLLPLSGATRRRGVLVIEYPRARAAALDTQRALLDTVAQLVATALDRLHFAEVAQTTELAIASERLRSSILSALSHDVRTPITALYGMADALAIRLAHASPEVAHTAEAIRDQARRVCDMVANLLDMARLQAGAVTLRKEWQPIEEVIGASIKLLGNALANHPVRTRIAPDLPLLSFDAVLIERVLCNLLDNAAKYSPGGAPILLEAERDGAHATISVRSGGAGFPPDQLKSVFELFARGAHESAVPGVGVGLAICGAVVEAHGGRIEALNPPEGGACVRFTLPCGAPPQVEPEPEPVGEAA